MPLQNRMTPLGDLVSETARGTMMGNRGGRIHDPRTQTLLKRQWASKRWICCVTEFKNRQRTVMGEGYTEVFFLDEVTALSCGHRPCFECRRKDALAFQATWQQAQGLAAPPMADAMDHILHAERLDGRRKRLHDLTRPPPDGAMVLWEGRAHAVLGGRLRPWQFEGYGAPFEIPDLSELQLLTPPAIAAALENGYSPAVHGTGNAIDHDL